MKMILARIGWGTTYDSEQALEGGGYESGSDRFNFQIASDGNLYGFFPVGKGTDKKLNLQRIEQNLSPSDRVEDVLVVWVATHPKNRGQYVVGWYANAVVLDYVEKRPDHGHYRVWANLKTSVLIPVPRRDFRLSSGIIGGQSSIRYYPAQSDETLEAEFSRIADYIDH